MPVISVDRLREVLRYDPQSGLFFWRVQKSRRIGPGCQAGWTNSKGYVEIQVDGSIYKAHRLAWFYVHGQWPVAEIDHKGLCPSDNSLPRIREATKSQNGANRRRQSNNQCGFKGVCQHGTKWRAQITKDGKRRNIGVFDTPALAHAAYIDAAMELHGEYARAA